MEEQKISFLLVLHFFFFGDGLCEDGMEDLGIVHGEKGYCV